MPKNYNLFLKGYVGAWDFSADMVNAVLDKNKDKEVHVLIDSTGGELYTAPLYFLSLQNTWQRALSLCRRKRFRSHCRRDGSKACLHRCSCRVPRA